MAKRSRKKRQERSDFAKVRLKVGRRLPKCLNETRVSLATGKIVVREQQLQLSVAAAATEDTGSAVGALVVKKLRSTQLDERVAAAGKLAKWLSSASCASVSDARQLFTFNELSEYLAPCLRDAASSELRAAARRVFAGLLERGQLGQVPAYRPALFHALRASWCHLDDGVQLDALNLLADLLSLAPGVAVEFAPEMCRLFCQLRLRTATTSAAASSAAASPASWRSRRQLLRLAECFGRLAELLRLAGDPQPDACADAGLLDAADCLGSFDLNEAAWSRHMLSWRCDAAADAGRSLLRADDFADVDNDEDGFSAADDGSAVATREFEASLAGLAKDLLPADFAGRVAGAAAYAEMLGLLRCLRGLLALHFGRRQGGCDCLPRDPRKKQQPATCCSQAVASLLAASLCPLFPLTVLACQPSSGGQISQKKGAKAKSGGSGGGGGRDALRDVAGKARALNSLLAECALICGPALEAALDSGPDGECSSEDFVLALYKFLAAQYAGAGRVAAGDAQFWLAASRGLLLRHPGCRMSRLFLAFFADSLRRDRFERPAPVAELLAEVACARASAAPEPRQLDFLPACLVQQFDSAQLHLLLHAGQAAADDEAARPEAANSAVRCLLRLMSRRFPGAEAAAQGASDRLVRYCPDRALRRSLSAALALCS